MIKRQASFDVLRAISAFFVIFIHVNFDSSSFFTIDLYLKSLLRWCVPIFFLLSGYFLFGRNISESISKDRILKVAKIALAASLLYLPLSLLSPRELTLSSVILGGTWFHLWFLNSLLFGFAFLKLYSKLTKDNYFLFFIMASILVSLHYIDFINSIQKDTTSLPLAIFRFCQSVPLIYMGYYLRTSRVQFKIFNSLILLTFGVILCFIQVSYLVFIGAGDINPQYPIGTLFMTFGMFGLFQKIHFPHSLLSEIGRKYSLHVYILHPIVLTGLKYIGIFFNLGNNTVFFISVTVAPAFSFLLPLIVARLFPQLLSFISGSWSFSKKI